MAPPPTHPGPRSVMRAGPGSSQRCTGMRARFSEHQQQSAPAQAMRPPALGGSAANVLVRLQQQLQHQEQQQQQSRRALPPTHQALASRLAAAAQRQQRQQQHKRRSGSSAGGVRDIQLVCAELGLPDKLASVLASAAAKGQISGHPGTLMAQLVRLLPLEPHLAAVLGSSHVISSTSSTASLATLLAAYPPLLRCDPASLTANCSHVVELLGAQAAAAAVRRYPQVLAVGPFRISATLPVLQELLGYSSSGAAACVAARQPMLLLSSPDHLRLRWHQLAALLPDVPAQQLQQQVRRSPELLLMRPSTLAGKLKCLELIFARTPAAAAEVDAAAADAGAADADAGVASHQQQQQQRVLRVYQQHELSYRLQRLQQLAREQHVELGLRVDAAWPGQEDAAAAGSGAGAGVDVRVQRLVLKVPGLLSLNPATLHSHVTELQLLLGLQADDPRLARIVLLQPGLLTQAPTTLANKLVLLQHLTGREEHAVHEMVLRCPAVLCLSCASVSAKWRVLAAATGACRTWQAQLAATQPVTLAMMLCYRLARLQRLQYVVHLAGAQQGGGGRGGSSVPAAAAAVVGGSSSSSSQTRGRRRRRATTEASSNAGAPGSTRSQPQPQAGVLDLHSLPWRSWVQEPDARFCARFPGFRAWLQQQEQQQAQDCVLQQ